MFAELYPWVFGTTPAQRREDAEWARRVRSLQWLTFEDVGMPLLARREIVFERVAGDIRGIAAARTPTDKFAALIAASQSLSKSLSLEAMDQRRSMRFLVVPDGFADLSTVPLSPPHGPIASPGGGAAPEALALGASGDPSTPARAGSASRDVPASPSAIGP